MPPPRTARALAPVVVVVVWRATRSSSEFPRDRIVENDLARASLPAICTRLAR
tara:strand:- start:179 stop:337 length:159 start_codon:yes stop_codon:yes gene_type:complete